MKHLLSITGLLIASAALAAPGNWTGTITMYAQHYTPNKKDAKTPLKAFQTIADEYQKKNPGIKIQFVTTDVPDTNAAIRAKAAARELWDVYWVQYTSLNGALPKGVATDLTPFLKQPNPYIPGNKAWQDAMNKQVLAEIRAPNGANYQLNGDYVAFSFFYNKELFKKAGITKTPNSWAELLDASKKLKAAGVGVMSAVPSFPWWEKHFLSDFYAKDYNKLTAYDGEPGQSALDEAVAIQKGILSPEDPRFMAWWPVFKQFTDYWTPDYIAQNPDKNYDAFQDFVAGKVAMIYEGSYKPGEMKEAGVKFGIGAFNFPVLDQKVSKYATGTNTANAVGGLGAAFQYATSTPEANKSMTPAKQQAVVDWMRFFGTPKNLQRIVAEDGAFVPTWPGTQAKLDFDAQSLDAQINLPRRALGVGSSAPNLGWGDMQRIFGLYLSGNLTLDKANAQVQSALDRAAKDYATKNKVDYSKYK
ncbi:ABC transporter substrate-binding protein [Deinococcus marmoris]|uniref:ABC transporter substrate-binding protein n=1 Tax=Deinococcus marmoris TaxID=249408 RepID=UPI000497257F|nr:ABC transporter substrate-binding protein [Deinococcus marmoris]